MNSSLMRTITNRSFPILSGKIVANNVLFHKVSGNRVCIGDHPLDDVSFPETQAIFLEQCESNFSYWWLQRKYFPKVKQIYVRNQLIKRLDFQKILPNVEVFVVDQMIPNWAENMKMVKQIDHFIFEELIAQLNEDAD